MIVCIRNKRPLFVSARSVWRRWLASDATTAPPQPTSLHLYNSLTASLERLPTDQPFACYTCGPTVYAPAHLGHARTYVWVDILRCILEQQPSAAPILFVMNVTDVDDKILKASSDQSIDPLTLSSRLESEFWRDMDAMNVQRPHVVVRVTDYVDSHIVPFVKDLLRHGYAHEQEDGVYFSVSEYERKTGKTYLQFRRGGGDSKRDCRLMEQQQGQSDASATEQDESITNQRQQQQRDFCLWKRQKHGEALVWNGPNGMPGRPGWHIECSAMIRAVQEEIQPVPFYLHIGGVDLHFPHHTNEIAQSEAMAACCSSDHGNNNVDSRQSPASTISDHWIPHWMHTGHLHIDGMKMSKSLKNFVTVQDYLLDSATNSPFSSPADDFRWWCIQSSYRGPSTFTQLQMEQARDQRMKVIRFLVSAQECINKPGNNACKWSSIDRDLLWSAHETREQCMRALYNDMDGMTFCRELLDLVDKGATYLKQSNGGIVETIQVLDRTVRKLCAMIGFSDITCRAGLQARHAAPLIVAGGERVLLDAMVNFRASVRAAAMGGLKIEKDSAHAREILELCDDARDNTFRAIGIELLDGESTTNGNNLSLWRPCVPDGSGDQEVTMNNNRAPAEANVGRRQDELRNVPVEMFFKMGVYEGRFLEYDSDGFPTTNADGSEVSIRLRKKLQKKLEKHTRRLLDKGQ
ncbi:hypothetical protein MPSEU_000225500 [Mayamaea pseudoterrestris]|nr:hypothetical protein MPSEU_000225500 [Mayamaea pseudoterrestris]